MIPASLRRRNSTRIGVDFALEETEGFGAWLSRMDDSVSVGCGNPSSFATAFGVVDVVIVKCFVGVFEV